MLARQFAGAWPYLELIAASPDGPTHWTPTVVEAYWLGNALLATGGSRLFAAHLASRFEVRAGRGMADIATLALLGAVPHHNFHVLAVYPWVGLLRAGTAAEEPLRVLNACRIRSGRVMAADATWRRWRRSPLVWDGRALRPGPGAGGVGHRGPAPTARSPRRCGPGDAVALHWDWICDVLDERKCAR